MRGDRKLRRARRDLRRARVRRADPPPARLPGDRGDASSRSRRSRTGSSGSSSERREARVAHRVKPKPPVPRVALGRLVHGARRGARRLLRRSSRRSGSACARSAWLRRVPCAPPARAAAVESVPGCGPDARRGAYVYDFDEPTAGGRELLGGKGIGLAEMTQLGVPGPGGLHDHDRRLPRVHGARASCRPGLEEEVDEHVRRLEETTGKRFGDRATTRCSSRCARARRSRCRG